MILEKVIGILLTLLIALLIVYVLYKKDIKHMPKLFLGYIFLSIGIMLTKRSLLGMAPWGVFHEGLMLQTGLSFGVITQIVGLIVLVISIVFLKTKIGVGTILNVAVVGPLIDVFDALFTYEPQHVISKAIVLTLGIIIMTFGRSLYISAKLGSGPRDGVFVGLARVTKVDVKYIKPAIEFTVLFAGYLMGGIFGVGTVISVLISGYLVQLWFRILSFDPKVEVQHNIFQLH